MNLCIAAAALMFAGPCWAKLPWRENFQEALAEAKEGRKLILVDFQAPWCYSCYYMDKHVLEKEGFSRAAADWVLLKIDVDRPEGQALKQRYGVTYLPTYLVLDGAGKIVGRVVGERTEGDFLRDLERLSAGGHEQAPPEVEALESRLAAGEYDLAVREIASFGKERAKKLESRKDWKVLTARLALRQGRDVGKAVASLLAAENSCDLAYDIWEADKRIESWPERNRRDLLRREAAALEALIESRIFGRAQDRCADFRSPVQALAERLEKLGEKDKRRELLERAVSYLEKAAPRCGEDRNRDDNLRLFLDLAREDARLERFFKELIEAYPADYVYFYRFARFLQERGRAAEALPWVEKADKLCYGANRLHVTGVRARILADLGRVTEAERLLVRDSKAGKAVFPRDSARLDEILAQIKKDRR